MEFGDSSANSFDFLSADVAIVGAGVAGLYSAYCCGLANIGCVIVESLIAPGGQCTALYPEKRMYGTPGFEEIKAKDYIKLLSEQCLPHAKSRLFGYKVESISKSDSEGFVLDVGNICHSSCAISDLKNENIKIHAKYIILATGIGDMKPNIPPTINGVDKISKASDFIQFYCMNLTLYHNKDVIIAGGGDSAVDFAIDISSVAKSVTIIHRRSKFSCEPSKLNGISELEKSGKLRLVLEHNISGVVEDKGCRVVKTIDKEQREHNFEADHIVFCYGFAASLGSLANDLGLKMEKNLLTVDLDTMKTSIENCYAAGDIVTYTNKKKNVVPCLFEADRAVRSIKTKMSGG